MNHTYKVVYNESTNTYVAVAEFEPSKGKSKSLKKAIAAAVALAAAQLVPLTAQAAVSIGSTSGNSITPAKVTDNGNAVAVGHEASAIGTDVAVGPYATATVQITSLLVTIVKLLLQERVTALLRLVTKATVLHRKQLLSVSGLAQLLLKRLP